MSQKLIKYLILLGVSAFFISTNVYANSVYTRNGNIYYEANEEDRQVTYSGRDEGPALHPSGEWIYFVRELYECPTENKCIPLKDINMEDGNFKEELWRIKTNGNDATMLFLSKESAGVIGDNHEYSFASIGNIQFSPSGDKVYFETPNWVTSAGLNVMNPDGTDEKLLGGGNDTKIIEDAREVDEKYGNLKGYIVTNQHRYWWFGGSYDWYWLFTPDFEDVGPLGDDFAYFTQIGDIKYTDQSEKKELESKYILPSR